MDNRPDGMGTYTWAESGASTEGLWEQGVKEGEHIQMSSSGKTKLYYARGKLTKKIVIMSIA